MRMKVQSPMKVQSLTWYPPEVHSDERDRPPSGGPVNVRSWLVWRCGVSGRLAPPDPLRRPGSKGGQEHLRGWGRSPSMARGDAMLSWRLRLSTTRLWPPAVKKCSHPAVHFSDTSVADRQLIHFDWKGYELSPLELGITAPSGCRRRLSWRRRTASWCCRGRTIRSRRPRSPSPCRA